jgi:hypothetical protein
LRNGNNTRFRCCRAITDNIRKFSKLQMNIDIIIKISGELFRLNVVVLVVVLPKDSVIILFLYNVAVKM